MSNNYVALAQGSDRYEHVIYKINNEKVLFIPAYCALLVKNLDELDLTKGSAILNGTLILRFLTENLQEDVQKIISQSISFRINERPYTLVKGGEHVTAREEKTAAGAKFLVYTWRLSEKITFDPKLTDSPFDLLDIPIKVEMTSKDIDGGIRYRFNFHTHEDLLANMSFKKEELKSFKEFSIAYSELKHELLPEVKKEKGQNALIYSYYPVIRYHIALYRRAARLFVSAILPLLLLIFLALGVAFEPLSLGSRILNLGVLLLAYFAFLPTLRSQIPSSDQFGLVDQLGALYFLEIVFIAIDSVIENFAPNSIVNTIFVIIVLIYAGLAFALVIVKALRFKWSQSHWDAEPKEIKQRGTDFNPDLWHNKDIDVGANQEVTVLLDHKTFKKSS